jgi:hypothetical protein
LNAAGVLRNTRANHGGLVPSAAAPGAETTARETPMSKMSERLARQRADHRQAALVEALSRRVRQALLDAVTNLADGQSDAVALTVERSKQPTAPARMAAQHPGGASEQNQARIRYERCLEHYRAEVRPQDAGRGVDDVGAAVALFVVANFRALAPVEVTAEALAQLERQLTGVVRSTSAWATAAASERQFYFEQMAILAVLVGTMSAHAVSQGADAVANVQRAARGYLQQLLGLNPDQLTLGSAGLQLKPAAAAAVS